MSTTFIATLVVKPGKEQELEKLQHELSRLTHRDEPDTGERDLPRHGMRERLRRRTV